MSKLYPEWRPKNLKSWKISPILRSQPHFISEQSFIPTQIWCACAVETMNWPRQVNNIFSGVLMFKFLGVPRRLRDTFVCFLRVYEISEKHGSHTGTWGKAVLLGHVSRGQYLLVFSCFVCGVRWNGKSSVRIHIRFSRSFVGCDCHALATSFFCDDIDAVNLASLFLQNICQNAFLYVRILQTYSIGLTTKFVISNM